MQLCLECAESYVSQGAARTKLRPAVDAVRKALKNEREKLKEKKRQQQKKQRQIKRLLYAIEKKDSATVLKRLDHPDGTQADGTDENGHPFVVHANSAYRYNADPPRVLAEGQDVNRVNDVYRILTTRVKCENLVKPRIIDVGGNRFFVHDPSPTLILDDLGGLPALIDGDKNYGRSDSEKSYDPNVFIDRDPRVFSTILDFYHMGEHMKWTQKITDSEELLKALYREADYYLLPKLMKITSEKIKVRAIQAKLEKAKLLVPFLQTICSVTDVTGVTDGTDQNVFGTVDLQLFVDGESVEGFDGHAECSLKDFTNQATWAMRYRATEAICTAILEEKKWVLHLYLNPRHEDEVDDGDEYKQTLLHIQADLDEEFEETYKGFASFQFRNLNTDDDEDCIVISSP